LYRSGTTNVSGTTEGQFWSLDNPLTTSGYANQQGLPSTTGGKPFVIQGTLKPGEPFVTTHSTAIGSNTGGALEVVTPPGAVQIEWWVMP
jgi:hypothetical protein